MTTRASSATPTTLAAPAVASRLSSTPSPSSDSKSFIQEIDVFMENIGRLVKALEDKHSQRRFDVARPSKAENVGSVGPQLNGTSDGAGLQRSAK
ncbi:hypothetical protein DFH06DRAFT_1338265 [Mycena polygramma]|nr:hypothetical protein DFH06DRAFT_1338265 [Mycena polygramma]